MKRFYLDRNADLSGVSGKGRIAQGCQFDNGWCALTWMTGHCTLAWYSSIEELIGIHGHGGATTISWHDEEEQDENLRQSYPP